MVHHERWPRRFKARRIITRYASVYIIASPASGHYKIGLAKRPQKRLDQLQIGSPLELKLMAYTFVREDGIDPAKFEQMLHVWLKPYKTHGEWFDTTRQRVILAWHQVSGELREQEEKDKLSHRLMPASCDLTQSNLSQDISLIQYPSLQMSED